MKIAIVGAGIAGLCCAFLLHKAHEITLFESDERLGGHSNTIVVEHEGRQIPVDTGFIVFNDRTYPNFSALLSMLGVASQPAPMSFSVRCDRTGIEYGGNSLRGVFAQPRNLTRPWFLRMLREIASLGTTGRAALAELGPRATVRDLADSGRFSRAMLEYYFLPMAASIWSAPREALLDFPAIFVLRFFENHGMLALRERPQWRTVTGGSREYVRALVGAFQDRCRTGCSVRAIRREHSGVSVASDAGIESFDEVILAVHSDQALAMLEEPTRLEAETLREMPYQRNSAILHCDSALLPHRRVAWSGWNYLLDDPGRPATVTYNLTILQSLGTREPICVTLNDRGAIDPRRVIAKFEYHHPQYTLNGLAARARWTEISGVDRVHYCGAYWLNGFHEDGVNSAIRVCRRFGVESWC